MRRTYTLSRVEIWWWLSVPYLLVFAILVVVLRPTPGILAHIFWPLLILFWISLCSSLAWILFSFARRISSAIALSLYKLGLALVGCALGVYIQLFWRSL